jgi:hypothetical protein
MNFTEYRLKLEKLADAAGYHSRFMTIDEAEETLRCQREGKSMRKVDIDLARHTLGLKVEN